MTLSSPSPARPVSADVAVLDNRREILAMIASQGLFITCDVFMKLAGRDLPVSEMIVLRGIFSLVAVVALIGMSGRLVAVLEGVKRLPVALMSLRSFFDAASTIGYFLALTQLPLSDTNAISQFAPLAVTAGAAVFLGDKVGWRRWVATSAGLLGVLLIIKPGTAAFEFAGLWAVLSTLCVAGRDLVTRRLGPTFPVLLITFVSVFANITGGVLLSMAQTWNGVTAFDMSALCFSGVVWVGGLAFSVVAMQTGEISVVAPFRYVLIVFALAYGVFIFGEAFDPVSLVGVGVLILAGLYTLRREQARKAGA